MQVFEEFATTLLVSFALACAGYLIAKRFFPERSNVTTGPGMKVQPSFLEGWRGDTIFFLMYTASLIGYASLALIRHLDFHSGLDLAISDRIVWNSIHGRLMETSIYPQVPVYLGDHFCPIILGIVPLYAVWNDASVLLILQAVALTSAAFPIYWYARAQIGRPLALVVACSYFLSPALLFVNLYDFHEIALATPLLAFACFFLLRSRHTPFLVCAVLLLLVKEDMCLTFAIFGIFIFVVQRRVWGLALFVFGIFTFFLLIYQVIPYFRQGEQYYFVARYASLGNNMSEILQAIFLRPDKVWNLVWTPTKIEFLLHFVVPLGLVPLFGIDVLFLTVPTFGYLLLSDFPPQTSIQFHYPAALVPFFYFASVVALRRGLRVVNENRRRYSAYFDSGLPRQVGFAILILSASILSYYFQSPGPLARQSFFNYGILNSRTLTGRSIVAQIPRGSVVLTSRDSLSQFSGDYVYEFPSIPDQRLADYIFFEKDRNWYGYRRETLDAWLSIGFFEIASETENFLLMRRKPLDQLFQVQYGKDLTLLGYTVVPTNTLHGGETLRPILGWRANTTIAERYKFALQVVDEKGHVWAEVDTEPHDGISPTNKWLTGKAMYDQYFLRLPPTMPTGNYQLVVRVHEMADDAYLPVSDSKGNVLGTNLTITTLHIDKSKASWTASQLVTEQPLVEFFVDIQELRFLGYYPMAKVIYPGAEFPVGLYWRARDKPRGDYTVAVQLRDASGRVVFEQASRPANDTYPTTQWDKGEVLLDWHDLTIPKDLAPGEYQIVALLRDQAGNPLGEAPVSQVSIKD